MGGTLFDLWSEDFYDPAASLRIRLAAEIALPYFELEMLKGNFLRDFVVTPTLKRRESGMERLGGAVQDQNK